MRHLTGAKQDYCNLYCTTFNPVNVFVLFKDPISSLKSRFFLSHVRFSWRHAASREINEAVGRLGSGDTSQHTHRLHIFTSQPGITSFKLHADPLRFFIRIILVKKGQFPGDSAGRKRAQDVRR